MKFLQQLLSSILLANFIKCLPCNSSKSNNCVSCLSSDGEYCITSAAPLCYLGCGDINISTCK